MKTTLIITITALMLTLAACQGVEDSTNQEEMAQAFVLGSPTYIYDGSELEFINQQAGPCQDCVSYTYTFTSSQAGYGDRSEEMSAQVITPHRAVIVMRDADVLTATLDEQWNMLTQQMIGTPQEPVPCPADALVCPDGTVLVREGPTCQFPACPTTDSATLCTDDQRGMACTRQYDPVCALLEDGTYVTKGNACTACSDEEVISHTPGECKEQNQRVYCTDEQRGAVACTLEYNPVCGYSSSGQTMTHSNACAACANETVEYYIMGEC